MTEPIQPASILIRYGELSLKRNNRGRFIDRLRSNLRQRLNHLSYDGIEDFQGGLLIHLSEASPLDTICDVLATTPGISWFAPGWEQPRDPDHIADTALEYGSSYSRSAGTFAVRSHRSDKDFHLTSVEFNERVGRIVQQRTGLDVDLDHPDWSIHIQILYERAFLAFERHEGMGGLPVGTTGNALALLSGGIDSPVASIMIMKRGCRVDFLHFYSYPDAEAALDAKMGNLVDRLACFGTRGTLFMAPYHPYELGAASVPARLDVVLFRRHTVRVAQTLARRKDHDVLVTGENLGQVASQTIENLTCIDRVAEMSVLRPLVGMNKQEIIRQARDYGTYRTSVEQYRDCCAIRARHPKTKTDPDTMREIEREYDMERVDREVMSQIEVFPYDSTGLRRQSRSLKA